MGYPARLAAVAATTLLLLGASSQLYAAETSLSRMAMPPEQLDNLSPQEEWLFCGMVMLRDAVASWKPGFKMSDPKALTGERASIWGQAIAATHAIKSAAPSISSGRQSELVPRIRAAFEAPGGTRLAGWCAGAVANKLQLQGPAFKELVGKHGDLALQVLQNQSAEPAGVQK